MRNSVGIVFGASKAASSEVAVYLPPFLTALLFLSYVRITTAYFYATEKTKLSYMLVYAELVLSVLLMITLPLVLDLHGVWLAIPVAQGFTGCIAAAAKYRENH